MKSNWQGCHHVARERRYTDIPVIPTGSVGLDPGLGRGRIAARPRVEIFGPESSGKTTLTLHAIAASAEGGRHLRLHRTPSTPWT